MKAASRLLALSAAFLMTVSTPSSGAVDDSLAGGVEVTFALRPGYGLLGSGRDYGFYQLGLGSSTSATTHQTIDNASAWRSVAFGNHYALALKADSTMWGWGRGATYAFGDGTTNNRSAPTQVGSSKWIKVVAGLYVANSFGIRHDSTLWVWGRNQGGGLGTGDGNAKTTPVQLTSHKWLDVSNINNHGLAIRSDSTLWGWGWSSQNNLTSAVSAGLNTTPAQLDASGKWISVFAGYDYSFGIKADSTLWSWGYNQYGLTGLGTTSGNQATPVQVGSHKWLKVKGCQQVVMALRADSTLWAWGTSGYSGSNGYGLLGQGASVTDLSTPGQIGSSKWRNFALGSGEAIAIDASGGYWGWGKNAYGGIGDGTTTARLEPVGITPGQSIQTITFAALPAKTFLDADFSPGASASSGLTVSYASSNPAVATIVSGQIHPVGAGTATITASQAGNAGYAAAADVARTLTVGNPAHPHEDRKITGGNGFTLAIRDGVGLYGTGRNSNYRLGLGDTVSRNRYHLIAPGNWRHVDGGDSYALALKEDSTLWGWGYHYTGLGDGNTQHSIPAQIGSSRWITVSAGLYTGTNLGIRSDSTLWAWGENYYGLYGNGTTTTQSAPTQVGSDKWLAVSQAQIHALALKADHTLWAWGYANSGRRGDGATSGNITTPVQIGTDRWLTVAAGYETSYALRTDSTLWAWGPNIAGGTGQGTMSGNTTTPTQVTGGGKWIWLGDVNWGGAVAMKADSTLWTWGSNAETLVAAAPNRATPGQVGSAKWRQVTLGYTGGLGLDSAGDFYGWGYNSTGHVGDSSNTTRTAPTLSKFNRSQTLTFPALAAKTLGDADFAPGASANTGLAVTYSSSDTTVATLVSGQIHIVGAGTSLITASQAGNAYFDPADSSRTLTVSKLSQSLTFNALSSKTYGDAPFVLSATATSGLAATYSSSDTSVARISGDTVVGVGAGSTQITASQAGNASYSAAADVARSLTIVKATQTLSFPALAAKTPLDADFAPGATSSAGLAVSYASSDTLVASIISGQIHIVGVGTATITASQPGNGNYLAAADSSQVLTVGHASQSITFNALSNKTYGDADFSLAATASSGLPVSYASSDTSVARISGSTVTVVGAGSADITASQAGNATYSAASNVVRSLTVDKAAQTIAFPALAAKTLLDADFAPGATSSAGLAVSYASSNAAVATVVSGQIHIVGAGTATITATQPGNGNYLAAADSSVVLTVGLASQSITFNALSTRTYGDAGFTLGATASSGLTVTYASSDTTVARISGSTVTLVGAGSANITASQAGDATYSAATDVTRTLAVDKAPQSISFPALAGKTPLDSDFPPGATASSGLPVTYASSNTSVATIVSGQIHIVGTGTATITASQTGNGNYLAAADSLQNLTVGQAAQSITFTALSTKTFGDAGFSLDATASSGLTVTYASSDTSVARISGSTVTVVGAGSTHITASQAGNSIYSAAAVVTRNLTVNQAIQSISFPAISSKTRLDADFAPGATASSGLPVTYASSNTSVAAIVSGQIHILGTGTTTITASQSGNGNYLAAADSSQVLSIGLASQSITFNALSTRTYGGAGFTLGATASSGLTITYASSDTTVARISGSTVTLVGAGSANITASQAGDATYSAATDVTRTLTVDKAPQTISFPSLAGKTPVDPDFSPGAASSSGLPVSYASSNAAVATIVSGQIHIVGAGSTTITASQAGNINYLAAADSSVNLIVGQASQSITFNALSTKTFGDAGFSLDATASSGLTVTYASSDTSVAKVSGSTVTVVGAGSTHITASQAGNSTYSAAADMTRTLTVNQAIQSISFPAFSSKTRLDADFAPGATASSGLPVTYASSNTTVATIVSGQIHILETGTTTITASQPGNGNYLAAADSSQVLNVGFASQSITFNALPTKTFGDAVFSLDATASSGLTVTYASSDTTVARISGSTVTLVGAGSADITASQAGNAAYSAAPNVVRSLTVDKAAQSLAFPTLAARTPLDADFAPGATSSSGLPVSYVSSNTAVATLVSGQIHIVGTGTATLTASQPGNGNYLAAPDSSQVLTVGLAPQSITFDSISTKAYGDADFSLGATASSGLAVTYTCSDTTVARISGASVTLVGAGSVAITASQDGNGSFAAASGVTRTLTVNKAPQTLTFPALAAKTPLDADFAPGATASSGLPVSYASSNPAVATLVSGQIHIVGTGTAAITASQAGNANYAAAADLARTLSVVSASQTLAFAAPPPRTFGDTAFALSASASSGLPVTFTSSDTTVARISGSTVTLVNAGSATLSASQAGNGTYSPASDVMHVLTVNKAPQTLVFPALSTKTMGDADFAPGASASSGLAVSYSSSKPDVAGIIDGQVHIVGPGTTDITASQAGSANFLAADQAVQTLTVETAGQTIVFEALPTKTYGDSAFLLVASASSGLAVSFASSDTLVARIAGSTVTLVGAGTADITASQAGNTATAAAIPVTRTLTIAKAAQSLAFSLGGDSLKTEGDAAFRLAAASSAGLAVRYLSSDTAVARVIGDSVRIGRAGVAELSAHQDGDGRYLAAASMARTLRVRTAVPASLALADLNPAGTLDADTSILLTWATRIKAAGYRLQATRSPAAAVFLDTLLVDTSFTLSGLAFGSALDWRVAPFNATGQADFSPAASIAVRPAPPLPVDVARIPIQAKEGMGTTVELTWPPVESSTAYRVQASLEGDQVPIIDTVITSPSLTLKELSPGGKYVWRVAPMTGVSQAPFTPWLTFAIRDKDDGAVTRGVVTDSGKAAQVSDLVAVAPRDSTVGNVTLTVTEEKKAPAHLPPGFQPLTGNITLSASNGAGTLDDDQLTITLTPPDTSLDGRPVGGEQPLVYTVDSATGELRVVYDLPRDSLGRIVLPLSRGRSFILAVDTVAPVVKDSTPSEPRPAGSNLVIRGAVDDNIRNCRTTLRYRRGGEETFDSVTVTIDAQGRFELPLDLELDSTGFEYALTATDGRNVQGTPSSNVPVEVQALKAGDSLPSMQWRLFALPTLPKEFRWAGLAAELGTYGEDWKLAARTAAGLEEVGGGLEKAEAGIAYWLKSRRRGFTPSIAGGVAAPVNKPFERALPPKTWISFGNPFLFEVAWSKVLEATGPAAASLAGPYTYRDTAWVPPLEIPALVPWEGYYVYNASEDTVRLRIPAFKSRNVQPALAKASFHLQWQVRGADGKDAGNFFGGLAGQATPPGLGKRSGAATFSSWQTPKPASPEASLRAGFVSGEAAGLLLTDFRDFGTQGGLTFTARLSGLQAGRTYANRLEGFESLPPGTAVALADPATGAFLPWTAGSVYEVKPQGGEENRDLLFHAGSPAYVEARSAEFAAAHPFVVELRNFPNPMRGFAMVHFAVPATPLGSQAVRLRVFDMQGRLVGTLAEGPRKTGRHGLRWEARDAKGRALAAGSYRLLLEVGTRRLDRSLILLP